MCGRYTLGTFDWVDPQFQTDLGQVADLVKRPRFNVAPGQMILALTRSSGGANVAEAMKWGIEPPWKGGPAQMINARNDKLAESRFWKPLLENGRCAIPADGFYEWRAAAEKGGRKQPYWFSRSSGEGFAFAGLWRAVKDEENPDLRACVIITVEPNELVADVHNRMPAMLRPEDIGQWLNGDVDEALAALDSFPSVEMSARPVSGAVGNPRTDAPELIEAVTTAAVAPPPEDEPSLF